MKPNKALKGEIVMDILWSVLTCGIYACFWQDRVFNAANALIDEERFKFWPWFFLTILTCNIYNLYIQYKVGEAIAEGQKKLGATPNENLSWLGLLLNFFGLHIVALAIEQSEINPLCD